MFPKGKKLFIHKEMIYDNRLRENYLEMIQFIKFISAQHTFAITLYRMEHYALEAHISIRAIQQYTFPRNLELPFGEQLLI